MGVISEPYSNVNDWAPCMLYLFLFIGSSLNKQDKPPEGW